MLTSILAMAACVILSGYFSATETAFSAMNKTRVRTLAEAGNRRAQIALKLAENYDKLISTILIGNNIVNIAVASIGTLLFVAHLGEEMGATVSTVVVTIVVLIFGEITPKSIAKDHPESFAMFSAPMLRWLIWLFTPLNFCFSQWKRLVSRLFRSSGDSKMSQEELLVLLDEVQQEGAIDEEEGKLLKNAVEFGDLEAQDILTHRVDLEAVPADATREEVAACFDQSHFSRLLVYEENIDKIIGVIHQKDFYVGGGVTDRELREVIVPPLFVHQTEKIRNLLQTLRDAKSHMAIVVDEYGGTPGHRHHGRYPGGAGGRDLGRARRGGGAHRTGGRIYLHRRRHRLHEHLLRPLRRGHRLRERQRRRLGHGRHGAHPQRGRAVLLRKPHHHHRQRGGAPGGHRSGHRHRSRTCIKRIPEAMASGIFFG